MTASTEFQPLLAHLRGEQPTPAPWLRMALTCRPDRSFFDLEGADIELLTWGEVGRPGLLFLHGNLAHADWWSFIAPFFAKTHRCAAISWSGMGRSTWRQHYSVSQYARELLGAISIAGLDCAGPPTVIAHSFGGLPLMHAAAHATARLGGAIMIDSFVPGRWGRGPGTPMPPRRYGSEAEALGRFKLLPPQGCEHLDIIDYIARASLRQIGTGPGVEAWTWRFDPMVNAAMHRGDPEGWIAGMALPTALIYGEQSDVVAADDIEAMRARLPICIGAAAVPLARHHVMLDQPLALIAAIRFAQSAIVRHLAEMQV